MSDDFSLSPGANEKAKLAIHHALATREPYCVISYENDNSVRVYSAHPYTGLAIDRDKVILEFFASGRVEPSILYREGIVW